MAGTDRLYVGNPNSDNLMVDRDRLWAMLNMPISSTLFGVLAATAVVKTPIVQVDVPAGAYVYRVALRCKTAYAGGSGDLNVGDDSVTDRYIDGLAALAVNDIAVAPVPNNPVNADPVGGHYYASADTIDVRIVATGAAGSMYLDVWYYFPNTPAA